MYFQSLSLLLLVSFSTALEYSQTLRLHVVLLLILSGIN